MRRLWRYDLRSKVEPAAGVSLELVAGRQHAEPSRCRSKEICPRV